MTPVFRILLIVVSLLTTYYILKRIRQSKLQICDFLDPFFRGAHCIQPVSLAGISVYPHHRDAASGKFYFSAVYFRTYG